MSGGPQRIQLSRKKGWRMPDNTVNVARPTKWGNPYRVEELGRAEALRRYRRTVMAGHCEAGPGLSPFDAMLYGIGVNAEIRQLRGKNLACWCALDQPCHADVLLELANTQPKDTPDA